MARILVVDDDPYLRDAILVILSRGEHQVFQAENGEVGLKLCAQHNPDLVIVDLCMPVKDGRELIKTLKAQDSPARIVVVSALELQDNLLDMPDGDRMPVDAVVAKPFKLGKLLQVIGNLGDQRLSGTPASDTQSGLPAEST